MKVKNFSLITFGFILITTLSCTNSSKNTEEKSTESEGAYSLVNDSTKVSFTAYKTTGKVPVAGEFTKINISNTSAGETSLDAMNGAQFSIPVSSLFTNDPTGTRDPKILASFFEVLNNTALISGVFKVADDKTCSADVTLNGNTVNIPLAYTSENDTRFSFDGVMNLEDWDALDAVASLNKACEALHTGMDGVSKTWSEVAVHGEVLLMKN
ncbi:MAG: hypothetical protein RH948_16255 [Cyclobacteriaceae bacterium]